jgi:hypothetical protein
MMFFVFHCILAIYMPLLCIKLLTCSRSSGAKSEVVLGARQLKVINIAHSADNIATTGNLSQANGRVIMKRAATLLALVGLLASPAAQMAASTSSTPTLKAAPAGNFKTTPPVTVPSNTVLNFTVTDVHGVLLTCAKQQVDTDTFSGCTLAPGRTLDDLMTSIVQTIHAELQKDKVD